MNASIFLTKVGPAGVCGRRCVWEPAEAEAPEEARRRGARPLEQDEGRLPPKSIPPPLLQQQGTGGALDWIQPNYTSKKSNA